MQVDPGFLWSHGARNWLPSSLPIAFLSAEISGSVVTPQREIASDTDAESLTSKGAPLKSRNTALLRSERSARIRDEPP